ncbi:hypothetical protein SEVIR_3G023300v4 [Setaria viridis]|uniref:Uncharacterized protein n=1 Tax=Setaria viridis TaxID=4556 RepID=A0A4U6VAC7_SETVI|nr:hypothetical protein SEVIR_3G023300v2 [Setaria viridis]
MKRALRASSFHRRIPYSRRHHLPLPCSRARPRNRSAFPPDWRAIAHSFPPKSPASRPPPPNSPIDEQAGGTGEMSRRGRSAAQVGGGPAKVGGSSTSPAAPSPAAAPPQPPVFPSEFTCRCSTAAGANAVGLVVLGISTNSRFVAWI